ncbi:MAG: hypothetical protein ABI543_06215 [Ignavibacteria bacterium]
MNALKKSVMILLAAILIAAAPLESTFFAAEKTKTAVIHKEKKHKHKKHKKHKKSTKTTTNDKTKDNKTSGNNTTKDNKTNKK